MKNNNKWLRDASMNLLVDYYPEVQFRPYGSGATRANVLPWLKQLKLGYICVYAKGHSGYTTWPSSLKTQHNMLGQDMPKFFRDVTRESGTKLFLYYSGLLDGNAGLRHPEWRAKNPDGSDKRAFSDFESLFCSYQMCPLSQYWDEWVAVHLTELIQNYDPDGIWVDGDWAAPCHCELCRAKFRRETGWKEPWSDIVKRPDFNSEYAKFWSRVLHGWRTRFCAFIKSLKPDCLYSAGNVSPRREFAAPFDWRSGDFFSPGSYYLHDMARVMRWYGTMDRPYDAYVCDTSFTHVRKNVRSRTKTLQRMLQEAAIVAANGGAVGYWTYPLGNGAFVPSRMKKAIAVRKFLEERKELFLHTESAAKTAILVSDPSTPTFGGDGTAGAHKALAALHQSPDVMDETGMTKSMAYDLIVLPEQSFVDSKTAGRLSAFVRAGGKLLTSGESIQSPELQKLLGVRLKKRGAVQDGHVLLKTHDEPTGIDSAWDQLDIVDGARELYPLYLSWDQFNPELRNLVNNWPMHGQVDEEHPEPAGCPAAVFRKIGKGVMVHICTGIFTQYAKFGDPQILRWLREILETVQPQPFFKTDAPSWVDVSLRGQKKRLIVHFVNQNPGRDICKLNTDDTWVDEIPVIGPISCEIRIRKKPQKVDWEPGGKKIDFHYKNQILSVTIPKIHIHGCLSILL